MAIGASFLENKEEDAMHDDRPEYSDSVLFRVTLPSRSRLIVNLGLFALYLSAAMLTHIIGR